MTDKEIFDNAVQQLEQIDRYLSKNWMDEDFPSDFIWQCLQPPSKSGQEEQPCAIDFM